MKKPNAKDIEALNIEELLKQFRNAKTHAERDAINLLLSEHNITMAYSCEEKDPLPPRKFYH